MTINLQRTEYGVTVLPGAKRAALINAAILELSEKSRVSDGELRILQLQPGTYDLEAPIIGRSGVSLRGVGPRTVLRPTFTGAADDVTNAVIKADGEIVTATMSTSLSAVASSNSVALTVGSTGTMSGGKYMLVQGWNDGATDAPHQSDGPGVVLSEICQVTPTWNGVGLTVPLAWATRQHHNAGVTVRCVTPVVGFEVRDLKMRGSQSSVVTACGIVVRYGLKIAVSGVSGEGFSRAMVEMVGVADFRVEDLRSLGTNNSWLHLISCQAGEVVKLRGTPGAPRNHTAGVPRFPLYHRFRCTSVSFRDIIIEGTTTGIFSGGGHHLTFTDIVVRDVEITQAVYDALVAGGEWQSGGRIPLGWGSGFPTITTFAEWAHDVQIANLRTENLRAPTAAPWTTAPFRAMAIYLSDVRELSAVNIACVNRGSRRNVIGVVTTDMIGSIRGLDVTGHSYGFMTQNDLNILQVTDYFFDGVAADGTFGTVGIYFDHRAPNRIRFRNVTMNNCFGNVRFGTEFAGNANDDPQMSIENLVTDDGEWSYVIHAENPSAVEFTTADIVEIDPTYTGAHLRVRDPNTAVANYQRRLASVAIARPYDVGAATSIMIAPLPQQRATVSATVAAVNYGDSVAYAATRRVAADNALDGSPRLGMALGRKAAGAESKIIIGAIPG